MNIGLFKLSISPCVSFGSLCLSRVWSILFIKLVGIDLFILILCYPLNIHKSVVTILLSFLILVICDFFLFFSLVSLGRSLSILLIFSKNKPQVLWNFLFCFLFPISLIFAPLFRFFLTLQREHSCTNMSCCFEHKQSRNQILSPCCIPSQGDCRGFISMYLYLITNTHHQGSWFRAELYRLYREQCSDALYTMTDLMPMSFNTHAFQMNINLCDEQ